MRSRNWFTGLLLIVAGLWCLQFFLFRQQNIFATNLKTSLYDNGWWVEKPVKVLFMGGSNAMNGVVSNLVAELNGLEPGEVSNIGMNQATPFEMTVSFKKLTARLGFPQSVYYVITPRFFYEGYQVKKEYERIFLSLEQWNAFADQGIYNNYFFPINIYLESLHFRKDHKFTKFHLDLNKTRAANGFQPNYFHHFEKNVIRDVYLPEPNRELFPLSDFQVQQFKNLITLCQKRNVDFYILLTPVYKTMYENERSHPERYNDLITRLNQVSGPFKVLGSLDPARLQLGYHDFINQDHMTKGGAHRFTRSTLTDLEKHKKIKAAPLQELFKY